MAARPWGPVLLLTSLAVAGCQCWPLFSSPTVVDVRDVFLAALRSPETFDDQIPTLSYHERAPECLRDRSAAAFAAENDQLRECGQLVTGSPAWTECHEEAEAAHNGGVILGAIADALDGSRRFDESQGGQFLILAKTVVGPADYEELIDLLEEVTPEMECELKCR